MEAFLKWFDEFGVSSHGLVFTLAAGVFLGLVIALPDLMFPVISWMTLTAPAWGPVFLSIIFWNLWINYRNADHISRQETCVLEIKIPRDIDKSPRAMELVFAGVALSLGERTFINRWIQGSVRPWFSFELVSDGGRIHFYVWTQRRFREVVETQVYAQYPNVEIYEVEDYAARIHYDPDVYGVFGCDFQLTNKDAYPFKTYVDYELDMNPKEEYRIDPIAHTFEFLSTLKPGEQVWYQIMIRTNRDTRTKKDSLFAKESKYKGEAADEIKKIREAATTQMKDAEGKVRPGIIALTSMQADQIKAIERTVNKQPYDTGIRCVYIAEKDKFRMASVGGMLGVFRQYSAMAFNGFAPARWLTVFNYPWQDIGNLRKERMKRRLMSAYRRRSYFHPPFKTKHFVLSSEELATIYHFPSRGIQAPGLERIPARKFEAPANLPTS